MKLEVNDRKREALRNGTRMEVEWLGEKKVEIDGMVMIWNELKKRLKKEYEKNVRREERVNKIGVRRKE